MLSCGALKRSNNPYIESIVETCVSKNQKEIFAMLVWQGKKSWKRSEAIEKSIHGLKAEFVYLCVRVKNKQLWNYCNHFQVMKISISKKDLKIAELLTKTYFLFYFRDRAIKGYIEINKRDIESMCTRVRHASKKVLKAGINLNWLWTINYGLLWLYTYILERFSLFDTSTNVLTGFMISLFLAAPALRVRRA